jgi:hypothetical protein
MSDLQRYITNRAKHDPKFAKGFEEGYARLKSEHITNQENQLANQMEVRK